MPTQSARFCRLSITALLLLCSAGCTQLALFTANSRAAFGNYTSVRDIQYGPGARNRLDVYQPVGNHTPHPVVIFIHGGGWNSGDKRQYQFVGAALAEAGMTVVMPNYSLYPSAKFPVFMADIARSIVWTADHVTDYGGDPGQIYLVGHSAGAHIATLVTLNQAYLNAAGGDAAVIKGVVGLAGPYDFYPFKYAYMNDLFGPAKQIAASQPVNFARADAPPMLLLQGMKDTVVDPRNASQLAGALRKVGAAVQEVYYPDAGHGDLVAAFSPLARNRAPVLEAVTEFVMQQGKQPATALINPENQFAFR